MNSIKIGLIFLQNFIILPLKVRLLSPLYALVQGACQRNSHLAICAVGGNQLCGRLQREDLPCQRHSNSAKIEGNNAVHFEQFSHIFQYFARNATSFADGQVIEHSYSEALDMREQLHQKIMDEFHAEMEKGNANHYLSELPYEGKWLVLRLFMV